MPLDKGNLAHVSVRGKLRASPRDMKYFVGRKPRIIPGNSHMLIDNPISFSTPELARNVKCLILILASFPSPMHLRGPLFPSWLYKNLKIMPRGCPSSLSSVSRVFKILFIRNFT